MPRENSRVNARRDAQAIASERQFLAIVTDTSGGLVEVRRLESDGADVHLCAAAAGLASTLSGGETVLCVVAGGQVIVLAEVVTS